MNKAAPWSIKGVDFDTREAAREAAHRAGMPLGDWLNRIIAEQAEELGVKIEEIDRDARLEAVKERLARLAETSDDEANEAEPGVSARRGDRPTMSSPTAFEEGDARRWRRQPQPSTTQPEPREAPFFRQSSRFAESANEASDTALSQVARRLAGIERQLDERSVDEFETPVKAAISRLERRIETLAERAEDPGIMDETLHHFDRKLNAIARKLDQPAAKTAAERSADMERIEAKLNALMTNLDRSPRARQTLREEASAEAPQRGTARRGVPLPTPRSIDHAVSEILQRQRNLDHELESSPDMEALKSDIAALSSRVEDMRRDVIERDARDVLERRAADLKPREPSPELQSLRRQVGEMSDMLAELAPRDLVAAVEAAVRDLGQRIEASRQEGVRDSLLAPIEQHFTDLHHAMRALAPTETIDQIGQEIKALGARIDGLTASGLPPQELELIRRQTQETRDLLAKAISHPLPIESIQKQIGILHDRIDALVSLAPSPAFTQSLARSLDEIRVALSRPVPAPSLEPLENRIEALTRKVDHAIANDDTGTKFDALSSRVDDFHRSLAAHIAKPPPVPQIDTEAFENSLRDISQKLDRSNFESALEPLENRIEQLARKLDGVIADDSTSGKFDALAGRIEDVHHSLATRLAQVQAAAPLPGVDTDRLEALVGELAQKVDNAHASQHDSEALEALQSQIEKVVQRLDRSDADIDAIGSLERTIGDLFTQLEESQSAAEAAARDAARDAVRQAVLEVPANSPTSDSISLELADLRALQDAADRRTHATLTAVHETLEKVVDRLAMLEDEITEVRPAGPRGGAAQTAGGTAGLSKTAPLAANEALRAASAADPIRSSRSEPDVLIEPGSGMPPARRLGDQPGKAAASSAEAASAQANFIAAARRAAQAASAEAKNSNVGQRITATASIDEAFAEARARAKAAAASLLGTETDDIRPNAVGQALSFVAARKRPILLSLAGLVILIGALQVVRRAGDEVAPSVQQQPAQSDRSDAGSPAAAPAQIAPASAKPADGKPADAKPALTGPAPTPAASPNPHDGASLSVPPSLNKTSQLLQPPLSSGNPSLQAALGSAQNFSPPAATAADRAPVGSIAASSAPTAAPALPTLAMAMPPTGIAGALRAAASAGDPSAQYLLGVAYADGRDIARDYGAAAQWLGKAAAQNLAPAEYRLASLYEKGLGVQRDDALAKVWYQRAADQGNVRAMHNLAVLSAEGADGKPDYATAARWFTKAANFGVRDSQFNLAILYARGLGTEQSLSQSYFWFAQAAAQGDDDAAKKRDDVATKLSTDQLAAAKGQIATFSPQTPDPAANDVPVPPAASAAKAQASAGPVQTRL